jgi:hypothetical protein
MEVFLFAEEFWELEIRNVTILEFSLILFGDNIEVIMLLDF